MMDYKETAIQNPTAREKYTLRCMIVAGVFSMTFFLITLLGEAHREYGVLYILLMITIAYGCLKYLHEWYHYFSMAVPETKTATHKYAVDIFTTYCPGEPFDMLEQTLTAIQQITYPHTTWCCDEGNDPAVKALCGRLNVQHVTRTNRLHAKAGNINNALKQAKGELCVILDPDHVPAPGLLDQIVPHFDDQQVGFVQIVQAYYNHHDNLIAKGAAQQTYQFYGPMMMSMHSYGTVQAIGANCTFRRAALDSIGGHMPGLAEDMNTAMHLHARGWKSVYLPAVLTRGLVPASLSAYYRQQLKWSRGTFELLFTTYLKCFRHFSWRQRLHYFSIPCHYLCGLIFLINFMIPVLSLFTGEIPLHMDFVRFLLATIPFLAMTMLIRQYVQKWVTEETERGLHVVGGLLQIGTWWVHCTGFVYTLLRKKVPYIPTPKHDTAPAPFRLHIPNIIVVIISMTAIIYGLSYDYNPFSIFMAGLAAANILLMLFIFYASGISQRKASSFNIRQKIKTRLWLLRHRLYAGVRQYPLVLSVVVIVASLVAYYKQQQELPAVLPGRMHVPANRPVKTTQALTPGIKTRSSASKLPDTLKGVVYDKGYHWFRNRHTLLRHEVEADMAAMKSMHINTVMRTVPGIYDHTLLRAVTQHNMNLIARFWMSPGPENEMDKLLEVIKEYRHEQRIIAWNLGNDVLYHLHNLYDKPDYIYYQNNYLQWLATFCKAIRALDSIRPITMDITWNKEGQKRLALYRQYLPDVDNFILMADSNNLQLLHEPIPADCRWGNVPADAWHLLANKQSLILPAWQDIENRHFVSLDGLLDLEGRHKPGYDTVAYYWANRTEKKPPLPDLKILKPSRMTYENSRLAYNVLARTSDSGWRFFDSSLFHTIHLSWYLIRTDQYGTTLYMKKMGEGPSLLLTIPKDPQYYRLYLQAISGNRVKEATSTLHNLLPPGQ